MRLLLGASLLSLGCTHPTQLIVELRADSALETSLGAVTVRVCSQDGNLRLDRRVVVAGDDAEAALPLRIPIEPVGGDAAREFVLYAEAAREDGTVAGAQWVVGGFSEGQTLEVVREFSENCAQGLVCPFGETCRGGACVSARTAGAQGDPPVCDPRAASARGEGRVGGSVACRVTQTCVLAGPRDLAQQPFDECSPFNRPLGSAATFAPLDPDDHWRRYGWFESRTVVAVEGEPGEMDWTLTAPDDGTGAAFSWTGRLDAQLASRLDAARPALLVVVDSSRLTVLEAREPTVTGDIIESAQVHTLDLRWVGAVVPPVGATCGSAGVAGGGSSAFGGVLRQGELARGIRHALAFTVPSDVLSRASPNGLGWVYPGSCAPPADSLAAQGNVHLGTLLGLPPSVDVEGLAVATPLARQLARALQRYGAYVVSPGAPRGPGFGGGISVLAESEVSSEVAAITNEELGVIFAELRVVTNATLDSPAGGGVPLACFAAPTQ